MNWGGLGLFLVSKDEKNILRLWNLEVRGT